MVVTCLVSHGVARVERAALVMAVLVTAGALGVVHAEPRPPQAIAVEITARRFAFVPNRIEVVEGDMVTLAVRSADGTHGFEIRRLKIKEVIPRGGSLVTVAFIAPKPGNYQIECAEYCGLGHDGMKGTLVVKPRIE